MSPKTVALVLKGSCLAGVMFIVLMIILPISSGEIKLIFYGVGLFFFLPIFDLIFVFLAPVQCDQENCHDMMHRVWFKEDGFRLTYQCDRCGYTYDTNFTFGGGGDSYN